jgi:hypothetical protein
MTTSKRVRTARKNVKVAATAARRKKTIAKLPKRVRTALGKQANRVKRAKKK